MDDLLSHSVCSADPDSPGGLNRGCILDPTDVLYHDLSVIVPETPSPQLGKRRRHALVPEEAFSPAAAAVSPERSEHRASSRKSKRRRLAAALEQSVGFVPASSLRTLSLGSWLEAPLSTASCSSSSSSSSSSSLTPSSEEEAASSVAGTTEEASRASFSPAAWTAAAAAAPSDSLSFLTAEERRWLREEQGGASTGDPIVISDDEEAAVRSVQEEEDEALARILQAQFDQEEAQRLHLHHHHHLHQQQQQQQQGLLRHQRHLEPSWMPQVLVSPLDAASPLIGFPQDLIGHQRRHGRRRDLPPQFSEDLQGNDYEALLEFEERQGAVVSKKLSRREVQRFPTKTFKSVSGTGNTQCQICFCDYSNGEKLRMLPCFHDYHVKCIDRWLKDNATCPICRANLADSGGLADPL
ncbi:uncharacterized protein V6R79_015433 [Siganus canaliculatus]